MQTNVLSCLCLSLGSLFGAASNPQFVVASSGLGCIPAKLKCAPSPAFTSTGSRGRSAYIPRHPKVSLYLPPHAWLPIRLSH